MDSMKRGSCGALAVCMMLSMSGCSRTGSTVAAVLFFICGGLLLLVAALRTANKIRYIQKRKAQGRRVKTKPNTVTGMLYIIAVCLLLSGILVSCTAGKTPASEPDAATTTTVATTTTAPQWIREPERQITATQYFSYDVDQQQFVTIAGDQNERIYPASVTKLFTAFVALQWMEPTDTVTAGDELDYVVYGSSVADIQKGEVLSADMLVEAMLLPSGNDAAYILAAEAGRRMGSAEDSVETAVARFVEEMNKVAVGQGMTGTHFANPDGIHSDDHYTTYHDLTILGTLALKNETIRRYAAMDTALATPVSGAQKTWKNTNELLNPMSPYYCAACIGLKTGQTPFAGSCLLSAFEYGGRTWLVGVFGCPEEEDRFPDSIHLFNQAAGLITP